MSSINEDYYNYFYLDLLVYWMQKSTYMCMYFLFHIWHIIPFAILSPLPSYWKTLDWITEDKLQWMRDHNMVSKQIQHALLSGLLTHNWSQNWENAASLFPNSHWKNTRSVAYGMKKGNVRLNEASHFLWHGQQQDGHSKKWKDFKKKTLSLRFATLFGDSRGWECESRRIASLASQWTSL